VYGAFFLFLVCSTQSMPTGISSCSSRNISTRLARCFLQLAGCMLYLLVQASSVLHTTTGSSSSSSTASRANRHATLYVAGQLGSPLWQEHDPGAAATATVQQQPAVAYRNGATVQLCSLQDSILFAWKLLFRLSWSLAGAAPESGSSL
jgi:hypothetical protein